ncbi:MAG TPA: MlaD family protein [Steroidobacteraceae bacterium]|jgi:phospholipid/cholesterol/gamma-HCH transport system substrate-binding protein
MEREANYVAVGVFVLLLAVMGVLFVYWYADSREHRDFVRYEIYFDGTVSGLTEGGPVRYLGVEVGRVQRIRIDPRADNRVQVVADIDSTTPISDRTLAQLSLQGVTGLLYIDLQQQRPDDYRRVLAAVPSERYPVIRSVHSDFDQFLSSLPSLTSRLNDLFDRTSKLLSDDNVRTITRLIGNVDQAAAGLPRSTRNLDGLVDSLRDTTISARRLIDDLHGTTTTASVDFLAAVQGLRTTSDNLATTSSTLSAFASENRTQLSSFVSEGLPQLQALLRDSRQAVRQIDQLSRTLNENPSRLIYQPQPSGVTIPP